MIRLARNELKNADVASKVRAAEKDDDDLSFPSAAGAAFHPPLVENQPMPNLVLVLVESWGLPIDQSIREALNKPYSDSALLARYDVSQGTVPFYGPTIAGEARELCNSKFGFHLLNASSKELESCLPDKLRTMGYHTIALHGMDGHMFDRSAWYNVIGFQEIWFRDRFRKQGLSDCAGAFTGTCDSAVAGWIANRLGQSDPNPDFIYWVTLNSHLPVPTPPPLAIKEPCSAGTLLAQQSAFCSWYQLISNVHHSVVQVALSRISRPTVFVIVGDHAPGFSNALVRSQFSNEVVPYMLLVPRSEDQSAKLCASKQGCGHRVGISMQAN
jgi:hypothetical protein